MAQTQAARRGAFRPLRRALAAAGLTLAALAAPASAQPVQINGDPSQLETTGDSSAIEARNALARAGYLPNLTGFQSAIEAADTAAIPFYQTAGLVLTGDTVRSYVNPLYAHSDTFDPAVADLLVKGGVDREDFCLNPSGSWDHYFIADRELDHIPAREKMLRGLCGDDDTVLAIGALHTAEALRLDAMTIANKIRPGIVAACIERYTRDHPMEETLGAAAEFSLFDLERINPPHDTVLMELSSWHLSGQQIEAEDAYARAIESGCGAATPAHVVNSTLRDRLASVLALLRPDAAIRRTLSELEDEQKG